MRVIAEIMVVTVISETLFDDDDEVVVADGCVMDECDAILNFEVDEVVEVVVVEVVMGEYDFNHLDEEVCVNVEDDEVEFDEMQN